MSARAITREGIFPREALATDVFRGDAARASASVKGGELSEFLGKEIVEGDSRFVAICLHFLAHIHDRGVELGVARGERQLLLEEAVADAIALGLSWQATYEASLL
jgi:hypothetical protein